MFSLLAVTSAAASALGSYNIARFVVTKGIEKRRKVKEYKRLAASVQKAVTFGEKLYLAASDGISPEEAAKAKAFADRVAAEVAKIKASPAPAKAE